MGASWLRGGYMDAHDLGDSRVALLLLRQMSPADKRTVRQIIFEQFDYIVSEWHKFQEQKDG